MPRALVGLMFFPRGGSSHVVRALAENLPQEGWDVTGLSGSRTGHGDAHRFFPDLDVRVVDFTAALAAEDPMRADPPMHPSFEDRPGAADRIFAQLDDELFEHQVAAWSAALEAAGAAEQDVLYLHHLTPLHEAAARVAPGVPVVTHLHGTELLMLEEIDAGAPPGWPHAAVWAERMRAWARGSSALVVQSPGQVERAAEVLGIDGARCAVVPNGFDPEKFDEREPKDRRAFWARHLVEEPQGWAPGEEPGSVAYEKGELESLERGPVLLYVGRFTGVKRIPLLIRAFARAQGAGAHGALVILGGHPGEWEGEHPLEAIEASGARDVFLAGWHDHEGLPEFLNASDVVVLPSVREQFGQVLVEGMACGLPAIAVNRHGPSEIVEDGRTGWLVEPDDETGLATVLAEVIADERERSRRGEAAREAVRGRYAWPSLAARVSEVLARAVNERQQ